MQRLISDEKIILNNKVFNVLYELKKTKHTVFFSCNLCGELFSSKNEAKDHVCRNKYSIQKFDIIDIPTISPTKSKTQSNSKNFAFVMDKLIRFVCVSNIPLCALDNIYFRSALSILNDGFIFPLRKTMSDRIIHFSDMIKQKTI